MTIRKIKMLFNGRYSKQNFILYPNKKQIAKKRALSYLHASMITLFFAIIFITMTYFIVNFDESSLYDTRPFINIILTPEPSNYTK